MGLKPPLQLLLICAGRKATARVLPNQRHMHIPRAGMARIGGRVVPQELELMGDEGPDSLRHVGELRGEIAQVLDRFQ